MVSRPFSRCQPRTQLRAKLCVGLAKAVKAIRGHAAQSTVRARANPIGTDEEEGAEMRCTKKTQEAQKVQDEKRRLKLKNEGEWEDEEERAGPHKLSPLTRVEHTRCNNLPARARRLPSAGPIAHKRQARDTSNTSEARHGS